MRYIRQLVNHSERQNEIHPPGKIVNSEAIGARQACLNPIEYPCRARPALQRGEHFRLNVDGHDPATGPKEFRHLQGEKAHSAARLENPPSLGQEGSDDLSWVLPQPTHRAGKEIAKPPRADCVSHVDNFSRTAIRTRGARDTGVASLD